MARTLDHDAARVSGRRLVRPRETWRQLPVGLGRLDGRAGAPARSGVAQSCGYAMGENDSFGGAEAEPLAAVKI